MGEHQDALVTEELLDDRAVGLGEAGVVDAHSEGEGVPERLVLDPIEEGGEGVGRHAQELRLVRVRVRVRARVRVGVRVRVRLRLRLGLRLGLVGAAPRARRPSSTRSGRGR